MKPIISLCLCASVFNLHALPEHWDVDLAAQPPQVFTLQRPRGETYELEAVLKNRGKPFEPAITNACIYWQTNGMENLYWSAPASVSNNVLRATWLPSMDPGATTVRGYIGDPGHIYAAAFQFRFVASPGALPNELPLPQKVIDFAKVRVLNPPWEGGGGVNTNAVIDIIHKTVDGSARPLPRYLHALDFCDSYPDAAEEYYRSRGNGRVSGGCSAVRDGGFLCRNFDYPFDDRAEFVVRMSASTKRFASVGVAQVGTNLTEQIVTSGKPSRCYKWIPGATVDGINENGVVAEINVVDGDPQTSGWHTTGDLHPLAAVRWALDNGTSAGMAASNLAANIRFPQGWTQNFHYMIADETSTYIVENGSAHLVPSSLLEGAVMTNFRLYPTHSTGAGQERYDLLAAGANITNAWYTRAYSPTANWASEFKDIEEQNAATNGWARLGTMDARRATGLFWQSVHTSVYDISNKTMRIAVQETDDWYTFQVPSAGGVKVETDPTVGLTNGTIHIKGETITPITEHQSLADYFTKEQSSTNATAKANAAIEASTIISNKADKAELEEYQKLGYWEDSGYVLESYLGGNYHASHIKVSDIATNLPYATEGMFVSVGRNGKLISSNYSPSDFAPYVHYHSWNSIVRDKPVTLEGYGITDAVKRDQNYAAVSNAAMNAVGAMKTNGVNFVSEDFNINVVCYGGARYDLFDTAFGLGAPRFNGYASSLGSYRFDDVDKPMSIDPDPNRGYVIQDASHSRSEPIASIPDIERRISATYPAFSNAVLAVGLNIDTNSVAVLNEIAETFGGFPIEGTATTVGGLLAALAAAVAWLKRKTSEIETAVGTANTDLETALNGEAA